MVHRIIHLTMLACLLYSCQSTNPPSQSKFSEKTIDHSFQELLDSTSLAGCILLYDEAQDRYISNSFLEAEKYYLPASTFKIPNSIIGLETGIVKDKDHIFKWNGEDHFLDSWEEDMNLREAFQRSCVPCYQELARTVGVDTMRHYLKKMDYKSMDVHEDNIDAFWLVGESKINAMEQIKFLKRLANEKLPISKHTFNTMMDIMIAEQNAKGTIRAKTGLSVGEKGDIGWYVGWLDNGTNNIYFATLLKPIGLEVTRQDLMKARKTLTYQALKNLDYY